jgi:hypothetical protein
VNARPSTTQQVVWAGDVVRLAEVPVADAKPTIRSFGVPALLAVLAAVAFWRGESLGGWVTLTVSLVIVAVHLWSG